MGYRIDFTERDGTLSALVSGKASRERALRIARDIREQAARQATKRVLVDVRRLVDRVGTLGTLFAPRAIPACPVAVVDDLENDPYYAFSEHAARVHGRMLRCFDDRAAALRWLRGDE